MGSHRWVVRKVERRWTVYTPDGGVWCRYNSWYVAYMVADLMARRER